MAGPHGGTYDGGRAESFILPLQALQWAWGDVYEIGVNADGWHATRRAGKRDVIRADSPQGLRDAITADITALQPDAP